MGLFLISAVCSEHFQNFAGEVLLALVQQSDVPGRALNFILCGKMRLPPPYPTGPQTKLSNI